MKKLAEDSFLHLPQVLELIPVCKSAWWHGCKDGRFPKPIKLGPRTSAWRASDIAALMRHLSQRNTQGESNGGETDRNSPSDPSPKCGVAKA